MLMMYWYNGELIEGDTISLKINDPSLIYGANVFTTLRVYQQSLDHPLTQWVAHCDRLKQSLQAFTWTDPNWKRVGIGAKMLSNHYQVLRIVVFADGREWITGRSLPAELKARQTKGIRGWVAEDELYKRALAGYKTGNYLGAWLSLQKINEKAAKEAILIDAQGNWLETATGNLWGWKDDIWWTPELNGEILPGIKRSHLINHLNQQGIKVKESQWHPQFVQELEIIAYSNCVVEIVPFYQVLAGGYTLNFNPQHEALKQIVI
jgi:4-amino-4-deoxychorismate lyase